MKKSSLRFVLTFQLMSSHLSLIPQLSFITGRCPLSSSSASYASLFSSNFFCLNSIALKHTLARSQLKMSFAPSVSSFESRNDNANVQSSLSHGDTPRIVQSAFPVSSRLASYASLSSFPPQSYCLQGSACTCVCLQIEKKSFRLRLSFRSES